MPDKLTERIASSLTTEDKARLAKLAEQEEREEAWIIRKAVLAYLTDHLKS